jgi:uncharacterized membrane protein
MRMLMINMGKFQEPKQNNKHNNTKHTRTEKKINQINKVQWVDFKLENVLVSLHSLKTMGLIPFGASAPLFLRNGELLGHSPYLL